MASRRPWPFQANSSFSMSMAAGVTGTALAKRFAGMGALHGLAALPGFCCDIHACFSHVAQLVEQPWLDPRQIARSFASIPEARLVVGMVRMLVVLPVASLILGVSPARRFHVRPFEHT